MKTVFIYILYIYVYNGDIYIYIYIYIYKISTTFYENNGFCTSPNFE